LAINSFKNKLFYNKRRENEMTKITKTKNKLLICIFISIVMVLTMIPITTIYAAEESQTITIKNDTTSITFNGLGEGKIIISEPGEYRFTMPINDAPEIKNVPSPEKVKIPINDHSITTTPGPPPPVIYEDYYYLYITFTTTGDYTYSNNTGAVEKIIPVKLMPKGQTIEISGECTFTTSGYGYNKNILHITKAGVYTFISQDMKGSINLSASSIANSSINSKSFKSYSLDIGDYEIIESDRRYDPVPRTYEVKKGIPINTVKSWVWKDKYTNIVSYDVEVSGERNKVLKNKVDYTYTTSLKGDIATVIVTGKGNYFGTVKLERKIKLTGTAYSMVSYTIGNYQYIDIGPVTKKFKIIKYSDLKLKTSVSKKTGKVTFKWKYNKGVDRYQYKYRIKNKNSKKYGKWSKVVTFNQTSTNKLSSIKLPKLKKGQEIQIAFKFGKIWVDKYLSTSYIKHTLKRK
jgi:hypothetical protein